MNRKWLGVTAMSILVTVSLLACAQSPTPSAPATAKPAEKAAAQSQTSAPAKAAPEKAAPGGVQANVAMATGPTGAVYHTLGSAIAKTINQHTGIKTLVQPYAGPSAWLPMLDSGQVHLGVSGGLDVAWCYVGGGGYSKPLNNIRVLMHGNDLANPALIVRVDSNINKTEDLKGKRVASEYGGQTTLAAYVRAGLECGGITWDDVKPVPVPDIVSGINGLRDGRIDATFAPDPMTPVALEADQAVGIKGMNLADIPPDQVDNPPKEIVDLLDEIAPGEVITRIPKAGYLKADTTGMKHGVFLVTTDNLSADTAYEITKAIYEFDEELWPSCNWGKQWKKETMFDPNVRAPYHEGAVRFWKEIGKWNDEAEANQKKLLGQ